MSAPTVFLSAATIDLEPWRDTLHDAFSRGGFRVLTQGKSLPSAPGDVRRLLTGLVHECDCVIHLAGMGYGSEAQDAFPGDAAFRCSWTQFEYYYAHSLGKDVIAFVCAPDLSIPNFQETGDSTERERKRLAQLVHRDRVASGKFDGTPLVATNSRTSNETIGSDKDLLKAVAAAVGTLHKGSAQAVAVADDLLARVRLFQIPPVKPGFTGRSADLAALRDLDSRDGGTASVINGLGGMGGIGKSELAKVLAHEWRPRFPDAQLWLDGYGTRTDPLPPTAGDLIAQVIRAFHPQAGQLPEDLATLQRHYREALEGKKALIVLDNAADAAQAGALLPPEGCGLIVTSRRSFLVGGKAPHLVGRLPEPEAVALLREICPDLGQTDAARVAARCGGLPLALRLAGAHFALDGASPAAVAAYLAALASGRLSTLDADAADAGEVTIQETLRLSVDSLPPTERAAWLRLGAFAGDFDATAARAVAGDAADANGLARLVRRSLLERETGSGDGERYRLHDLAADFARDRLVVEEGEDALDVASLAHARHYATVGDAADRLYLAGDPLAGLVLFDSERVQIESAFAWLAARPDGGRADRTLLALVDGLAYTGQSLRFHPRQSIVWREAQATAARRLGDRETEGSALGNLGIAHAQLGAARRAIGYFDQQLEIVREVGDRRGEGAALGNLGLARADLGDARRAIWYYEQQLAIVREIGDRRGEGNALSNLGNAHLQLGEVRRAIGYYEQALEIDREIGDRHGEGNDLGNLGVAHRQLGDSLRAIGFYEQALEINREIGDRRGEGGALGNLGNAYLQLGDARRAIEYHEQQLEIVREIGDLRGEGATLANLGNAHADLGETHRAIGYYEQHLEIVREIGDQRGESAALGNLGNAYLQLGDARRAIRYCEQAMEISREIGDRRGEGNDLWNAALAHRQLGERAEALSRAQEALTILEAIEDSNAAIVRAAIPEWRGE